MLVGRLRLYAAATSVTLRGAGVRQVLQNLKNGETRIVDAPYPQVKPGHLLIRTRASLVSPGTERMLVAFGRSGLLAKARQQPERVQQVLDKVKTDGLLPTAEAIRAKLDQPVPLGYCNAGVVVEVGEGVQGFKVGDPVVSNGPHAEVVCVPANLCARIPSALFQAAGEEASAFERAAFTVLGAVALQGIRLAAPTLGEVFVVTGLGLVGLLAVQMLRAHGCRVLGIDPNSERVSLARRFGAIGVDLSAGQDPVAVAMEMTGGRGVDGVLLTAATRSSEPVHQAAGMCRKRGRIVLVGVTGLELRRDDFYKKELTFQVSCSYGPGRYDPEYEDKGKDYPYGFVRWTAQRNFEAVLQLLAEGKLDVDPLISRRVPIDQAPALYEELAKGDVGVGTIITYPDQKKPVERTVRLQAAAPEARRAQEPVIGVIGAGNFATRTILPLLQKAGARRKLIATRGGLDAAVAGRKFGFEEATTEVERVFADEEVNTVFVLTPHSSHADFVCRALGAGKHVFVEKPLATTPEQVEEIRAAYQAAAEKPGGATLLHVGFNRRFAPLVLKMRALLRSLPGPKSLMMMVNAGQVEADHWIQDPHVGGGRIIGEACHFIDLLRFLAGASITTVQPVALEVQRGGGSGDTVSIALTFEDGSIGTVHYWANGSRTYPKERLEVFGGGRVLVLDNFRRLKGYNWPRFRGTRLWRQDKGHQTEITQFLSAVEHGGHALIPFEEIVEVTEATFRAAGRA